jgi:hypothetical protein
MSCYLNPSTTAATETAQAIFQPSIAVRDGARGNAKILSHGISNNDASEQKVKDNGKPKYVP